MTNRLHDLYRELSAQNLQRYAVRAGTTTGFLRQVALYQRPVSLGLADALVAAAPPKADLTLRDIPLTPKAVQQLAVRRRRERLLASRG